jgi:hypothetical protein
MRAVASSPVEKRPARSAAHRVVSFGIADYQQRIRAVRHPQLVALDLTPR